ncbi:putative RNA-binding protein 18 [Liparis tanakae]|uniref:Putative RNA-binding protein 18 n=1 Tax=Liparis tanakae TaxID=230148 RepID=A0A4Z2I2C5_9TELE|nr:putative RNA-binding protein 18 [Liparis tanakae]
MSSSAETVKNASIMSESVAHDGNRLWIGNIDPKITEYHLVKLLEKFGHVQQFDFLFHKSGPLEGQPRGYCFVNFNTRDVSRVLCCLLEMFGRWFFERNECSCSLFILLVPRRFEGFRNDKTMPPSLEPSSSGAAEDGGLTSNHLSTSAKIRAIEAKLQMMEENPEDDYSGPSAYVYNKPPERKRWEPYSKSHHNNQSRPFRKFRR